MNDFVQTSDHEVHGIKLMNLTVLFAKNFRILILFPFACGLASLGVVFLLPATYTATTRILPPAQHQSTSAAMLANIAGLTGLLGGTVGMKNPADQYVALLKSQSVYDAIIGRFNLKQLYDERYIEDARKELEKRTKVSAGVKDGIISIEAEDADPKRAAAMANAFVEELRELSKRLAISEAAQRRLFFETQVQQTKHALAKSEQALRTSGVSAETLKTVPQSALETLARLKAQITVQEIKLASMRTFMTEANPEFRLAVNELAALRTELAKVEQSGAVKLQGDGGEYIAKYRDFKYQETLFELMVKQYELARLDEAREGTVIQVVDEAHPPERRSGPKRALIVALITVSSFLAVAFFVLLREAFQKKRQLFPAGI